MRILGIDPGTRHCGYGMIERAERGRIVRGISTSPIAYVECGVIDLPARDPLERRLSELARAIAEVIADLSPEVIAVEDVFHGIDARAALTLGHARGVVLSQVGAAGLVVHAYPPATVKKSVAGHGAAQKDQVSRVVMAMLALKRAPKLDATDALAVAICHAHHVPTLALIASAARRGAASRGTGTR